MYSVKPWGKAYLVGSTIGSTALGVGMRLRETYAEIIEKRPDPYYEVDLRRRCVIPQNTIRNLIDLGASKQNVLRVMKPAGKWKFMSPELATIKEVETYTGCSPSEPVFHCTEGDLLRALRRDFLRFGGAVHWQSEAFNAAPSPDDTFKWMLHKDFGPCMEGELIVSFARAHLLLRQQLLVPDPESFNILFDEVSGVVRDPIHPDLMNLFGKDFDVLLVVGNGLAMHLWRIDNHHISWRCITKGRSDAKSSISQLHPLLSSLISSVATPPNLVLIPGTAPAIKDEALHFSVSIGGDALLPVDMFEWRGDNARQAIEEASATIRTLYGNKFHRGNIPQQLREIEQDYIVRRASLLKRDLVDAEHFLAMHPQLPKDDDDEPEQLRRIGDSVAAPS